MNTVASDFYNLTPHAITFRTAEGDVTVPPSGELARVATEEEEVHYCNGLPVIRRKMGKLEMPAIPEGKIALVSAMCLEAASSQNHPEWHRIYAPDTGATAIREGGQIKAVTRLVCCR